MALSFQISQHRAWGNNTYYICLNLVIFSSIQKNTRNQCKACDRENRLEREQEEQLKLLDVCPADAAKSQTFIAFRGNTPFYYRACHTPPPPNPALFMMTWIHHRTPNVLRRK
jgi:hypothetical protein